MLALPLGSVPPGLGAPPLGDVVMILAGFGLGIGNFDMVPLGLRDDAAGDAAAGTPGGRRGGVIERTRWRGTASDPFSAAWVLRDDSGVDGCASSRVLTGLGEGDSGDLTTPFLAGTGAETRRDTLDSLGRLEIGG